jgi:hypothetical protein
LKLGDGGIGPVGAASLDVGDAAPGIVDQQQVDALPLQPVVVVQPVGVDQRHIALAVLGDDPGLHVCWRALRVRFTPAARLRPG